VTDFSVFQALQSYSGNPNYGHRKKTGSEYLHPLFATPQQAVDFVDRGRTATRHHGKQTLRASGFDESQESERSKLRGMNPIAIRWIR